MRKGLHMRLMENRYHKVAGLDPVLNWSRKKCGGPRSGPKLIHAGKKKQQQKKKKQKKNNKKTKKKNKTKQKHGPIIHGLDKARNVI